MTRYPGGTRAVRAENPRVPDLCHLKVMPSRTLPGEIGIDTRHYRLHSPELSGNPDVHNGAVFDDIVPGMVGCSHAGVLGHYLQFGAVRNKLQVV